MAGTVSLDEKVYAVSESKSVSMRELLASFKRHGVARVTDLHLKTGFPPTYRADGDLRITQGRPLEQKTVVALAKTLLGEAELATLKIQRSVNTSHLINEMRYRVNCFYDRNGLAMAIRALDTRTPDIEWVGFPNRVWEDITKLSQGLVLLNRYHRSGQINHDRGVDRSDHQNPALPRDHAGGSDRVSTEERHLADLSTSRRSRRTQLRTRSA